MANKKFSDLTSMGATVPAADDRLAVMDKSDTTDASTGTTKAWEWLDFLRELFATRFGADAGASDTYVVTLVPTPAAYVTGGHYRFKANTANTGSCTVNFNSLGAKTIKKAAGGITTDLATDDIRAGQWVDLVYDGTNMQMQSLLGNAPTASPTGTPFELVAACSDEDTALVAGDAVLTFRMPRGVTLTSVRASLKTAAGSGTFTIDINEGGSTILSTLITIDATEKTSVTAATPPVISDASIADDAEMTIDITDDADGTASGLKVTLIGTRV